MSSYLTPSGELDEAAIRRAVAAEIGALAYRRGGRPTQAEIQAAEALARNDASREQALAAGWPAVAYDAARAFIQGALAGLTPEPQAHGIAPPAERPAGSFERAEHCQREIYRQRRQALDATLARITASRDIVQYLEAAE